MRRCGIPLALVATLLAGCNASKEPAPRTTGGVTEKPGARSSRARSADPPAREALALPPRGPADMLPVPGGTFTMGLDGRGIPDEQPAHDVTVGPFLLDKTEVTNEAYQDCVDAGACPRPARLNTAKSGFAALEVFRTSERPVVGVSHDNAEAYCRFRGKRLPTEAEWERAARGDDGRLYPWGSSAPTPELAVFRAKVTEPVGSRPDGVGPYGHLDLAGNVWEWVADRYDPFAYVRSTADSGIPGSCSQILSALRQLRREGREGFTGTNPIPTECEHVLRGGAFNYSPWGLRSTNRVHHAGRFRIAMAGFRCAADYPGSALD